MEDGPITNTSAAILLAGYLLPDQRVLAGLLPNPRSREGERPREPKHLLDFAEIRAREDARPPMAGLGVPYVG